MATRAEQAGYPTSWARPGRRLRQAAVALWLTASLLALASASLFAAAGELDPGFGQGGATIVDFVANQASLTALVVQPDGKLVAAGASGTGSQDFLLLRYDLNGELDREFGSSGRVFTDFGGQDAAAALALHPDGKLVAAGRTDAGGDLAFAVARYNPDGSLDAGFGNSGRVFTDLGADDAALALALQADGKLVAAGTSGGNLALTRYNPDGSLDSGFGEGGRVFTDCGGADTAFALRVQADGKLVVAGSDGDNALLVRYSAAGTLDPGFGAEGRVFTDFGGVDGAHGLAIQADGKLVTAGSASTANGSDFALARYLTDGTLDPSFGSAGRVFTDFGGAKDAATALVVQAEGKLVAAGTFGSAEGADFALSRYHPDGSLDRDFGANGRAFTDFGSLEAAAALAIHPDGRLVAGGASGEGSRQLVLARYATDGVLDHDVPGGGRIYTEISSQDFARALVLQPDGALVLAGTSDGEVGLARHLADGRLDPAFGGGGLVRTNFGGDDLANALAVQANGKLVVAGSTENAEGSADFLMGRYNPDGTLDPSFSEDGLLTLDLGDDDDANALTLEPSGTIVVAGRSGSDLALIRVNPDGGLDQGFGVEGRVSLDLGSEDVAYSVVAQPDGQLVVGGSSAGDFLLARFAPDGTLDLTFGDGGVVTSHFGGGEVANALGVQVDGRLVAAGSIAGEGGIRDFQVARYEADGSLDPGFGVAGSASLDLGGDDEANAVTLQPDGRIVLAGSSGEAEAHDVGLVRYLPDGSLDDSFASGGVARTDFGSDDVANAIVVQPDGKPAIAGFSGLSGNFLVARYQGDAAEQEPEPVP